MPELQIDDAANPEVEPERGWWETWWAWLAGWWEA